MQKLVLRREENAVATGVATGPLLATAISPVVCALTRLFAPPGRPCPETNSDTHSPGLRPPPIFAADFRPVFQSCECASGERERAPTSPSAFHNKSRPAAPGHPRGPSHARDTLHRASAPKPNPTCHPALSVPSRPALPLPPAARRIPGTPVPSSCPRQIPFHCGLPLPPDSPAPSSPRKPSRPALASSASVSLVADAATELPELHAHHCMH
ncbi:hypothetical protein BDV93DRAFT_181632 [Ceratobasidium sp. AG-I]|nr:hypothetical protein BDV93DRAFT_181632 [Ceratobasidium sp. AG-I]